MSFVPECSVTHHMLLQPLNRSTFESDLCCMENLPLASLWKGFCIWNSNSSVHNLSPLICLRCKGFLPPRQSCWGPLSQNLYCCYSWFVFGSKCGHFSLGFIVHRSTFSSSHIFQEKIRNTTIDKYFGS